MHFEPKAGGHGRIPATFQSGIRYDLSDGELRAGAELFLRYHPPRDGSRHVCYRVSGADPWANIGRTIESHVFLESFGDTIETMQSSYGPYESACNFFISFDLVAAAPVGVLRVASCSPSGFMTLNDVASGTLRSVGGDTVRVGIGEVCRFHHIHDLDDVWDVGTVAVLPEHRGQTEGQTRVSLQLYRALYISAIAADIKHLISVIDKKALREMTLLLGIPFMPLAATPPLAYLGSAESRAVYAHVPDFYRHADRHYQRALGRFTAPLIAQLLDGTHGVDESLQFLTEDEAAEARWKAWTSSLKAPGRTESVHDS